MADDIGSPSERKGGMTAPAKFLVVAFDGLRPDMVSPELSPNLCRFRQTGTALTNATAVFPTDTSANIASFVTGTYPQRHGVMGNAWYDPAISSTESFAAFDAANVEQADRILGGALFCAPTLGEILADRRRTLAIIGMTSTGTTRLLHHKVRSTVDHICIHCHDASASSPDDVRVAIDRQFGPPPPVTRPDTTAVSYSVDVFLQWLWPHRQPDVTVIWFNEPDSSYHWCGIGSDEALHAIRHCDAEFGRLLDWWLAEGQESGVQL